MKGSCLLHLVKLHELEEHHRKEQKHRSIHDISPCGGDVGSWARLWTHGGLPHGTVPVLDHLEGAGVIKAFLLGHTSSPCPIDSHRRTFLLSGRSMIGALLKALSVFLIATGLWAGPSDMSHSGSFTLYKLFIRSRISPKLEMSPLLTLAYIVPSVFLKQWK